jgi:hypothetical protein
VVRKMANLSSDMAGECTNMMTNTNKNLIVAIYKENETHIRTYFF